MAAIGFILSLLALFMAIGALMGWVAIARTARITQALERIERRLRVVENRIDELPAARPETASRPAAAPAEPSPQTIAAHYIPEPAPPGMAPPTREPEPSAPRAPQGPGFLTLFFDHVRRNWMAWLGGVSVALAGVFLVSYSIEMGYLGPAARIAAAIIAGLVLHAAAEYFRRKTRTSHPAFAALAGGASITLYAALLAALDRYELLSPGVTFALLAIVSLATMALATVHGPLLAALGLLGAYVVPILVIDSPSDIRIYLVYSLVITTSGLFLIRFIYRPWLWWGIVIGALSWWVISFGTAGAEEFRGFYLAAFAYVALAVPTFDWWLSRAPQEGDPATGLPFRNPWLQLQTILLTIVLIAIAEALSIAQIGFRGIVPALLYWSPLTIVVLLAARTRPALELAPWVLLLTQLAAWFVGIKSGIFAQATPREFLGFALAMALLFSLGTWLTQRHRPYHHVHAALIWLAPVSWLALAYLIVTDLSSSWQWAVVTLVLGLIYIGVAGRRLQRNAGDASAVWPILGGHLAYSLAAAMTFREATLTLALAAQLMSLAWLNRRFTVAALEWLIKGVLALVVARLTLNPWLLTYPSDVHWSLWTYGGSFLCCLIAARLSPDTLPIRKWLEAASLHILVLFLGAETRYWLYDGNIFDNELSLPEVAINTSLWGGLALTYFNRARHSPHLARFYTICSYVLMVLALVSYGLALTALNPFFGDEPIATRRVVNILLLAYGAPVLVALAARLFYEPRLRNLATMIAGGGFFVFVTLEIRHLWHRALDVALGTTNGELYTYSAAWLVMAVATMLTATHFGSRRGYQAGTGLLFVVIAKIFVFDMGDLEGLLRVASFMGLGLALLGLAWLYQRTSKSTR